MAPSLYRALSHPPRRAGGIYPGHEAEWIVDLRAIDRLRGDARP